MQERVYRIATKKDLDALVELENTCFQTDKLSPRSLKRWIKSEHGILMLVEEPLTAADASIEAHETVQKMQVVGYGLVWCHRGTRLARLYSLAVNPIMRGKGLAKELLVRLENLAAEQGRLYMRLEVSKSNLGAIRLYEQLGYKIFGEYSDYYEDHNDALRMQKQIRYSEVELKQEFIPWYQQTTEFTCGPAALMMAMHNQDASYEMSQEKELDIWREATTIFMTSGHGGCHPVGLALAALDRGFDAKVYLNTQEPLFLEGVRTAKKKNIMLVVHDHFMQQAMSKNLAIHYEEVTQLLLEQLLSEGYSILILISTYRLDGKKAPHWVMITSMDDQCLYVHDPDLDNQQQPVDCQYLPIGKEEIGKMSTFGRGRLRTIVAIRGKG